MNKIQITQDQKLASMLTSADTLYELSGTFDLGGEIIGIPSGSVLKFTEGCKITNGTISLNNTVFEGAKHCIAALMSGTQYELDTDDFDLTGSNKVTIMQSIVSTATSIQLHGRLENVFDNIIINKETTLIGNGATIANTTVQINKALNITTDDFVRITDLNFELLVGNAIYKDALVTNDAKLSFIISNCKFKLTTNLSASFIKLVNSREGNITDCFFIGKAYKPNTVEYRYGIGIERKDAVNTNVISCMFSYLDYGIKATAVHITPDIDHPGDDEGELYSKYACGLNVQSAIIISCKYGVYIEGNDSFFLNNSMVDFCENPLVMKSQDGANVTNNYFSTASVIFNGASTPAYNATIAVRNNFTKGEKNRNQRIIIANNTIYGHRAENSTKNYGIEMEVESKDCTIQGNTINSCRNVGIHLIRETNWSIEKLVIDNNRLYLTDNCCFGIGNDPTEADSFEGNSQIVLSNNRAFGYTEEDNPPTQELVNVAHTNVQQMKYGYYLYHNNHFRKAGNTPTDPLESQVFHENEKSTTRLKLQLSIPSGSTSRQILNPMGDDLNIVVYIANNSVPIFVSFTSAGTNKYINFTTTTSSGASFTAIIEHLRNI